MMLSLPSTAVVVRQRRTAILEKLGTFTTIQISRQTNRQTDRTSERASEEKREDARDRAAVVSSLAVDDLLELDAHEHRGANAELYGTTRSHAMSLETKETFKCRRSSHSRPREEKGEKLTRNILGDASVPL